MKKSSTLQLETMVTFMEEHGDLNKPTTKARGKIETLTKWEELSSILNSDGTGETKPTEKWKKVWSDLKNNTKKKAARLHKAASGTGGGPAVYSKLTDLEQRVLNLIGLQVATGLALEEAGLSQDIPIQVNTETVNLDDPQVEVEEIVELWNQPGPSHAPVIAPPTLQFHTQENEAVEGREDTHEPYTPLPSRPQVPVPEVQPALSGQTVAQGSPRRCFRGSPRRVPRGSPRGLSQRSPQRSRRRSPRRLIRPARSEEAAQQFLNCDREWRQFRMDQHRDYTEIRREQNRIREIELQTQRDWQAVALRGLDILEKFLNNYRKDAE